MLCRDFDDAASPSEVFDPNNLSTAGGGTLSLDAPEGGPPPPSPPHALDVSLPASDSGAASALGGVAFGPLMNGIDCAFDALYDQGPGTGSLLDIQVEGPDIAGGYMNLYLFGSNTLISGFLKDGGAIFVKTVYSYQWTPEKWVAIHFSVDFAKHVLSLTVDGTNWGGSGTIPDLGLIGGGNVVLGWSGTPSETFRAHIDNLVCHAL